MDQKIKFYYILTAIVISIFILYGIFVLTYSLVLRRFDGELITASLFTVFLVVIIIGGIGEYIYKKKFDEEIEAFVIYKSLPKYAKFLIIFILSCAIITGIVFYINVWASFIFESSLLTDTFMKIEVIGTILTLIGVTFACFIKPKNKNKSS